jgi:hypothetical protein
VRETYPVELAKPNLLEHLCLERGIALNTKLKAGDGGNPFPEYYNPNFHFFEMKIYFKILMRVF